VVEAYGRRLAGAEEELRGLRFRARKRRRRGWRRGAGEGGGGEGGGGGMLPHDLST